MALCPHCGESTHVLVDNDFKRVDPKCPREHPILCEGCGKWAMFTRSKRLRDLTPNEFEVIHMNKACREMRQAWVDRRNAKEANQKLRRLRETLNPSGRIMPQQTHPDWASRRVH
jgi:NMD protein affecting ribosome stability and mRNA decay